MVQKGYISYRADYKYKLAEDYYISTPIIPKTHIQTQFIELDTSGKLLVKSGYAWDGPSCPVFDTEENMRASLIHDALYQLIRHNMLSTITHQKAADQLFRDICIEDGVSKIQASVYYSALRKFGDPEASLQNKRVIFRTQIITMH